jgi:hypothetical protein
MVGAAVPGDNYSSAKEMKLRATVQNLALRLLRLWGKF